MLFITEEAVVVNEMKPDLCNWAALFNFQRKYRRRAHLTAKQLLEQLEVPLVMTQFLCSNTLLPSMKPGTKGFLLREKLVWLAATPFPPVSEENLSNEEMVREFVEDNGAELAKLGVLTLYVEDDKLVVCTAEECYNSHGFEQFVSSSSLHFLPRRYTINYYLTALRFPICTAMSLCYGTSTTVLSEAGIVGVTAGHVLLPCVTVDQKNVGETTVGSH